MVLFTLVMFLTRIKDKDQEFKYGLMAQGTKDNGKMIKLMVMANFGTLMAISMKGNGEMTKQMVKVFIHTLMEPNTKVTGLMISSMGME